MACMSSLESENAMMSRFSLKWLGLARGKVALYNPTEHNLRSRLLVLRGQRLQQRVADDVDIALPERTPGLDLDAQQVVISDVLLLRHQRVHLYLVDGGAYLRV